MDDKKIKSRIKRSIARFMDPEVNIEVMLASSPEAAKVIIASLPGVTDMVDAGPEAGRAALDLLQREETLENYRLSAVALYILMQYPSEEVKRVLAGYINAQRFRGINSQLAAEGYLRSAGIKARPEDYVSTALREAHKLVPKDTKKSKRSKDTEKSRPPKGPKKSKHR